MTRSPKEFISEFLITRGYRYSTIPGIPLYSYKVSNEELGALSESLTAYKRQTIHGIHGDAWAAGFCLFVSEVYRREYGRLDHNSSIGGWSWAPFESLIGCTLSTDEHAELVFLGLVNFWKRPIRRNELGKRAFLGSLFAEGGLPWQLLQDEHHGFGRAVRGGLKYFYHSRMAGKSLTDLIGQYEDQFPQQFKTFETRQLIAGIIEQLMHLVESYPLSETTNPTSYLNQNNPSWADGFPIPLDEENGQRLINDWLRDAGRRRTQRTLEKQKNATFVARHKLVRSETDWFLQAEVTLPKDVAFDLGDLKLTTTRLELHISENASPITKLGYIYGDIQGTSIRIRFPRQLLHFNRNSIESALSLQVLANGKTIYVQPIENGSLDIHGSPWVFTEIDGDWWLVATESCRLSCSHVKVRAPQSATFESKEGGITIDSTDALAGQWYESNSSHHIFIKGNSFKVSINQDESEELKPKLQGRVALYQSTPTLVFLGWPELRVSGYRNEDVAKFTHIINQRQVQRQTLGTCCGDINYVIKDSNGDTILQRRFGVLPSSFSLNALPATKTLPSRISLKSATNLQFVAQGRTTLLNRNDEDGNTILELRAVGEEPVTNLNLEIIGQGNVKPISLYLNYPYEGVRVYDGNGQLVSKNTLLLSELLGCRLILSSSQQKRFILHLELMGGLPPTPKRVYSIKPESNTTELSLFSFAPDIVQILSSTDEQDARVRLSIDSDRELLRLEIHRYNGHLERSVDGFVSLKATDTGRCEIEAMLISDPKQASILISEITTQGVGTGQYVLPDQLRKDGPWILYPAKGSTIYFRPQFHLGNPVETEERRFSSLHSATKHYDPKLRPTIIDDQIEEMSIDLGHSGWQYLTDLKSNYSHLPLSSFLSWQSLARNPKALSTGLFRMEIDEKFCQKIRDELAIIWDLIPIGIWLDSYQRFIRWLETEGLPESYISSLGNSKFDLLKSLVPGFADLESYFQTTDTRSLPVLPMPQMKGVIGSWHQLLRQNHNSNSQWPTDLGAELKDWINTTSYPREISHLSDVEHMNGVTYLPMFMAHVTAGEIAAITLSKNESYLKFAIRVLIDFDRTGWYQPIHTMFLCHLLANKKT